MPETLLESARRDWKLDPQTPETPEAVPRPSRVPGEILETEDKIVLRELDWRGRPVRDVVLTSGCVGRADGK
jgi:hypothetical protein